MKKCTLLIIAMLISLAAFSAHAFETKGFMHPYGVAVDPKSGSIYVSHMNGQGDQKDDNGVISRLKADGTLDRMNFIDGVQGLIELNAPKGMAIIGNFLYVADIDAIRAFDINTGAALFNVNFGQYKIGHFYDLCIGPDGALYATDGAANTVYRIDVMDQHRVTVFIKDEALGQPHGMVWFSIKQIYLVAGWKSGQVLAFDREGKRKPFPAIFLKALEGIDVDLRGNAYVASTALGGIYRIAVNGALFPFMTGVDTPLDLAFQRSGEQLLIVSFKRGSLISYPASK